MYNQSYNNTYGVGAGFYGQEYHQHYYYQQHQQQQQQQQQQKQQMLAGVMSYYPAPESMAMVFNQYQQGPMQSMHPQQAAYQYQQQQQHQLDYQMTPALYLLNQQAELLQRSLSKPASSSSSKSKRSNTSGNGGKVSRKVRGPYQNKTLSPTPSPAAHKITPETDRLSVSSDLSCSVAQQLSMTPPPTMVEPHNAVNAATQQQTRKQKRKSDSFLEYERQATVKQAKFDHSHESAATATTTTATITIGTLSPVVPTVSPKQVTSIFRNVALMAESSCNRH